MKKGNSEMKYTEVWGDTVVLKELVWSCIIGVVLTMTMFLIGRKIFTSMESVEKSLANGYALLVGVAGCIISGAICANLFKPKRVVEEKFEQEDIEHFLEAASMTVEEEAEYLSEADPEIIRELEELELYALLALIPEGTKNYKPEYREKLK